MPCSQANSHRQLIMTTLTDLPTMIGSEILPTDKESESLEHQRLLKEYTHRLTELLIKRTELVLDFTSLQACLDPQLDKPQLLQENEKVCKQYEPLFMSTLHPTIITCCSSIIKIF